MAATMIAQTSVVAKACATPAQKQQPAFNGLARIQLAKAAPAFPTVSNGAKTRQM
jgi:hypothetical protein